MSRISALRKGLPANDPEFMLRPVRNTQTERDNPTAPIKRSLFAESPHSKELEQSHQKKSFLEEEAPVVFGRDAPNGTITRGQLFEFVTAGFNIDQKNGSKMCFREQDDRNVFLDYLVEQRIGSGSIQGEAHQMCTPFVCSRKSCKCVEKQVRIAVKMVPIDPDAWETWNAAVNPHSSGAVHNPIGPMLNFDHDDYEKKQNASKYEIWVELTAMTLANSLVLQGICPNLPLLFHWFVCDHCNFSNQVLLDRPYKYGSKYKNDIFSIKKAQKSFKELKDPEILNPCAIILNELAQSDLTQWCKNRTLKLEELESMIFQIIAGLYSLRKYYNMRHNDLHSGNILVHKLPQQHEDNGVFKYTIDGIDYYVPHYGWLFVIWDFGMASIHDPKTGHGVLNARNENWSKYSKNDFDDLSRISKSLLYDATNFQIPPEATKLLQQLKNNESDFSTLLTTLIGPNFLEQKQTQSEWNMDKQLEIFPDHDLERFVIR